jgi:hypothetical protein
MSDFTYPFYQSQVPDLFGDPTDPSFAPTYLRTMDFTDLLPSFNHVRDFEGNPWSGKIYGNGYIAAPLRAALEALIAKGIADQWKSFDGVFNIRPMKGDAQQTSMHAWGLAIDVNAATNPFSASGQLITDLSDEFIFSFTQNGMEWGGSWSQPKDPMHFQLPFIKLRTGPYAPVPWHG